MYFKNIKLRGAADTLRIHMDVVEQKHVRSRLEGRAPGLGKHRAVGKGELLKER